jgi:hypothetical protein
MIGKTSLNVLFLQKNPELAHRFATIGSRTPDFAIA